jgi:hypothetical protein
VATQKRSLANVCKRLRSARARWLRARNSQGSRRALLFVPLRRRGVAVVRSGWWCHQPAICLRPLPSCAFAMGQRRSVLGVHASTWWLAAAARAVFPQAGFQEPIREAKEPCHQSGLWRYWLADGGLDHAATGGCAVLGKGAAHGVHYWRSVPISCSRQRPAPVRQAVATSCRPSCGCARHGV